MEECIVVSAILFGLILKEGVQGEIEVERGGEVPVGFINHKESKNSARINASGLHSSLGKASGLKSSTQLSTLTRESPTVAAQNTNASAEVASILQLTRNGSTGRGGRVAVCSQNN